MFIQSLLFELAQFKWIQINYEMSFIGQTLNLGNYSLSLFTVG